MEYLRVKGLTPTYYSNQATIDVCQASVFCIYTILLFVASRFHSVTHYKLVKKVVSDVVLDFLGLTIYRGQQGCSFILVLNFRKYFPTPQPIPGILKSPNIPFFVVFWD